MKTTKKGQKLKSRQPQGLTSKQKTFADAILNNPKITGTQAAMQAYNAVSERTAQAIASENLSKPLIMEYLIDHAVAAEHTVFEVMQTSSSLKKDAQHASVALRAASDILDRVHGKATQKMESTSVAVSINIDLANATMDSPEPV